MGEGLAKIGTRQLASPHNFVLCGYRSAQEVFGVRGTDWQIKRLLISGFLSIEDLLLPMPPSGHHLRTIRSKC